MLAESGASTATLISEMARRHHPGPWLAAAMKLAEHGAVVGLPDRTALRTHIRAHFLP